MIGPDPFAKYENQTFLLNCQKDHVYRPLDLSGSAYEKAFYKALLRGKIIRLRSGKKQKWEKIHTLIVQNYPGEIWKP